MASKKSNKPTNDDKRISKSCNRILNKTPLCSLATINDDGTPHINTAFVSVHENDLFFLSDVRSTHCKNILKRPNVGLTIFDSRQKWDADKAGLQIIGVSAPCNSLEDAAAKKTYAKRFPKYAAYTKSQKGETDPTFRFFVVRIKEIKILDERVFGEENYVSYKPR